MAKRKPLSRRLRFEIFKRDGFRCLYCGATPVQKVLTVDHVVPLAENGTDDPANLATACFDCNAGKSAVPLDRKAYASGLATESQRDYVEQIREYLELQRLVDAQKKGATELIARHWEEKIGPMSEEMFKRLPALTQRWPLQRLLEAIDIAGQKLGDTRHAYDWPRALSQQKYFYGILRRWREEMEP